MTAVILPNMCDSCSAHIVQSCSYGPDDPWRALIITMQIGLWQAAMDDPKVWERVGADATPEQVTAGLKEIGCLGCFKPRTRDMLIGVVQEKGLHHLAKRTQTKPTPDLG